ncbi:MAG: hypothetical protein U0Q16_25845 [Bryobacteraceae bacterium]
MASDRVLAAAAAVAALGIIAAGGGCAARRQPVSTYRYDSEGRLAAIATPDDRKVDFSYGAHGQLLKATYAGGFVAFGYDKHGNRIRMKDPGGEVRYFHDAFDRLAAVHWSRAGGNLVSYAYGPASRISRVSLYSMAGSGAAFSRFLSEGASEEEWGQRERGLLRLLEASDAPRPDYSIALFHDILGRVTLVETPAGAVTYEYLPKLRQVRRNYPNGISTTFTFGSTGQMASIRHERAGAALLAEFRYEYDAAGRVTKVIETASDGKQRENKLEWKPGGYLSAYVDAAGRRTEFEYDEMGNRSRSKSPDGTTEYDYDEYGRLTSNGIRQFKWTAGDLLREIETAGRKTTLDYDGRGLARRLRGTGAQLDLDWDGDGNLACQVREGAGTCHVPDFVLPDAPPLADVDSGGAVRAFYFHDGQRLLGCAGAAGAQFYLEDGFSSLRMSTDRSGTVIGSQDFTPFAQRVRHEGSAAPEFRAMGERYIPELDSYLIHQKLYSPSEARLLAGGPGLASMFRFDSLNPFAHSCSQPELFSAPRCNQTQRRSNDVFVAGIETSPRDLSEVSARHGVATISTSAVGTTPVLPQWAERMIDPFRAAANYAGVPGGKTRVLNQLRAAYDSDPTKPLSIRAHSNGAITINNLKKQIAADVKSGRMQVSEVVVAGAGVANSLRAYFEKAGVKIPVREENPANRFSDIVRVITTPVGELGSEVRYSGRLPGGVNGAIAKIAAVAIWATEPFRPGEIVGTAHHGIEENYPGLLPERAPGPVSRLDFSTDLFRALDRELGGINLSASAEGSLEFGPIAGATLDGAGQLTILSRTQGSLHAVTSPHDFAIAWILAGEALAHAHNGKPKVQVAFSLDPFDPKNPRGPWLRAVYLPKEELLAGTGIGKAMFDADWLLKQYSFGVAIDEHGRQSPRISRVPGFKNVMELLWESGESSGRQSAMTRFWIEVKDSEVGVRRDGSAILMDEPRMVVFARPVTADPLSRGGLRDSGERLSAVDRRFVESFTRLYDEIALESGEFARLKEVMKTLVLALWLRENHVSVDPEWVRQQATAGTPTVSKTSAVSSSERRTFGNRIVTRSLFGGVNGTVGPAYRPAGGEAARMKDVIGAARGKGGSQQAVLVSFNGQGYVASTMPMRPTPASQAPPSPVIRRGGNTYIATGNGRRRRVTEKTAGDGSKTTFGYGGESGRPDSAMLSDGTGWSASGSRIADGAEWKLTSARGNEFRRHYDSDGLLKSVEVDGRRHVTFTHDGHGRVASAAYGEYEERFAYDAAGRMTEYSMRSTDPLARAKGKEDKIHIEYTEQGMVARITGMGLPILEVAYAGDGVTPVKLSGPMGSVSLTKFENGRFSAVWDNGTKMELRHGPDGQLASVGMSFDGAMSEYKFDANGLTYERDMSGTESHFETSPWGPVRAARGNVEATAAYDAEGRPREISLPGGGRIRYEFKTRRETEDVESLRAAREARARKREGERRPEQPPPRPGGGLERRFAPVTSDI